MQAPRSAREKCAFRDVVRSRARSACGSREASRPPGWWTRNRVVRPSCSVPGNALRNSRAARLARRRTRAVQPATRSTVASAAVRRAIPVASMARSARHVPNSRTGCRPSAHATASCSWARAHSLAAPSQMHWVCLRSGAIGGRPTAVTCTSRRRSSRRSCTMEPSRTSRWTPRAAQTHPTIPCTSIF